MPSLKALARDAQSKKKPAAPKKPARPAPPPASFKSTEYVQESDEEEQENSEKENESESDDHSLPLNPADVMITPNGKLQRPAGSSSSSENDSESEESGSEADDEDEEEEEGVPNAPAMKATTAEESVNKPAKESAPKVVTSQQPLPYKPPAGFEKSSFDGTLKASQMFKRSNLEGKQIWYFTAPAAVSISSIKQMPLEDATAGKAILNHNGSEYGFMRDSAEDKTYTLIMVLQSSDGYRTASKDIDQIFHLQQVVKLPGVRDTSSTRATSSRATIPTKKPARQQPQGLKMRFRPIGFGDGETGKIGSSSSSVGGSSTGSVSDEEMEEASATFRRPAAIASDSSEAEESSEADQSTEESSSSDVEMSEAPPLPIKPAVKDKEDKTPATVKPSQQATNGSLKRKHGEREEKKSKHSSSRASSIDDRELKRLKKSQTESQRRAGGRASASIKPHKSSGERLSTKAEATPSKKDTPIRLSKSATLSHSSPVPRASYVTSKKTDQQASEKQNSKKRERSEPATPVRKNEVSLQDLTRATDPSLTGEERAKKIKKLKHKE